MGVVTHEARGLPAFRHLADQGAAIFNERQQELDSVSFETRGEDIVLVAAIRFRGTLAGRSAFSFGHGKIAAIIDLS